MFYAGKESCDQKIIHQKHVASQKQSFIASSQHSRRNNVITTCDPGNHPTYLVFMPESPFLETVSSVVTEFENSENLFEDCVGEGEAASCGMCKSFGRSLRH